MYYCSFNEKIALNYLNKEESAVRQYINSRQSRGFSFAFRPNISYVFFKISDHIQEYIIESFLARFHNTFIKSQLIHQQYSILDLNADIHLEFLKVNTGLYEGVCTSLFSAIFVTEPNTSDKIA